MTRLFAAALLLFPAIAAAEGDDVANEALIQTFDPESAVAPISVVEGAGIKVGEGTVLRPVFGVETGFVSNVFYDDENAQAAAILRLLAQIGTGSLGKDRLDTPDENAPADTSIGSVRFRADLRASYDAVLSDNEIANDTGGLGLGASIHGVANPQGTWQFGFDDDYNRIIRAANFETSVNTNRNINRLQLALLFRPQGRSLSGSLYYTNTLDIFERDEQSFADRMEHRIGVRAAWTFLPKSQTYIDVSQGYVSGIGDAASMKVASYPLIAKAGLATLLTVKTTLNLEAGYTNGFYETGPSFSAPLFNAQIGYRYSPLGRVALMYSLQYQDSINANYFRDHVLRAWLRQIVGPLVVMVQPELHLRKYDGITIVTGPPTRDDLVLSIIGGASYNFRNWIAATVNYRFSAVSTDYMYMSGGLSDDPSFARHELLAGLRVAL